MPFLNFAPCFWCSAIKARGNAISAVKNIVSGQKETRWRLGRKKRFLFSRCFTRIYFFFHSQISRIIFLLDFFLRFFFFSLRSRPTTPLTTSRRRSRTRRGSRLISSGSFPPQVWRPSSSGSGGGNSRRLPRGRLADGARLQRHGRRSSRTAGPPLGGPATGQHMQPTAMDQRGRVNQPRLHRNTPNPPDPPDTLPPTGGLVSTHSPGMRGGGRGGGR